MTTARETALAALDLLLKTALQAVSPPVTVLGRNSGLEHKLDSEVEVSGAAQVFACLKDGDASEPDELLGNPPVYDHLQAATLELLSLHPDAPARGAALDAALAAVASAMALDPTLGGVCSLLRPQVPEFSTIGDADAPMARSAEVGIEVLFQSSSAIG